ncbi:MAG: DUF512 domain-containing protein [Firmicutes bacterium]|jgi:putative radical SAM enzyme (TIGR03279 family)|nr:DUF512 domain-containing protein [Bacillota bacterium]
MKRGIPVERVEQGSIADDLGLKPGDRLLLVDGKKPQDILEWRLAESSENLVLTIQHANGELVEYEIEKAYDEPVGLVFATPIMDKIRTCRNRCLFCFVDQMPAGMRKTLYLKDDDYRLSFLTGSYITLTNFSEADIERIITLHVSPLYVSVHATDPELRQRLMRNRRAGELLPLLKRLAAAGITFHTQAVLCPGLNDGEALEQTIADLYELHPAVRTLAVVPVGLTGHREELYPLVPGSGKFAETVLAQVGRWQQKALAEAGTRFVFASDEFYTLAGRAIPPEEDYEGYPQLENGVGLVRLLLTEWEENMRRLPQRVNPPVTATVATGVAAAPYLQPIVGRLNRIAGVKIKLLVVSSRFFGGQVTVTGLVTYNDLQQVLAEIVGTLYLPSVMLREGKELFLDGYTISDLSQAAQTEVRVVGSLKEFLDAVLRREER